MIKITKEGGPIDKLYSGTCNRCGCEFIFEEGDAKLKSDWRDGSYFELDCPNTKCGKLLFLVPMLVKA